ncbi:unnamed protein product, partial [Prunus brigantina]
MIYEAFGLVFEPFECSLELSIYRRSPGGTIEAEKICVVEPDRGNGFAAIVKGITSLNGAWDPEATWRFNHSIFDRVSYGLRLQPIIPRSRGREDSAFAAFLLFSGRQNA